MTEQWFRKNTWTRVDQDDFERHLKRSRSTFSKSQYLRIQAHHLQDANPPMFAEALHLLDRALHEYRDNSQVALALEQKAACLDITRGFDTALPVYREAIAFERLHGGTRTNVWTTFPLRIVQEKRVDFYDEAIDVLSFGTKAPFAIVVFRVNAVKAIITKQKGGHDLARSYAKAALEAAARTESGFRYHKNIGLVKKMDPSIEFELQRIMNF